MSHTEVGKQLGISKDAVFRAIKKLRLHGEKAEREQFAMPAGYVQKRASVLIDGEGGIIQEWKRIEPGLDPTGAVEAIKDGLADFALRSEPCDPPTLTDKDSATIYILADLHIGLLSWKAETGANYDLNIAKRTIGGALERLIAGSPSSAQAVVLVLGDLLHSDSNENMTAKSKNVLDVDGRHPKILRVASSLVRQTIELAKARHEQVLVRILPGNHDEQSAGAVALALAMLFENDSRVTVDDDPGYFWWWLWGTTLLGATHGDKAKMKDLPLIMAARNPVAWGRSKFRSVYTGHIHTQTGIEMSGVTVESFQTPVAPDAWHSAMGYGANRSISSITIHKELGEISRHKANIV